MKFTTMSYHLFKQGMRDNRINAHLRLYSFYGAKFTCIVNFLLGKITSQLYLNIRKHAILIDTYLYNI